MPKKIPMRKCLGCREMFSKKELLRVVRSPEGEISIDFKGKKPGRGAYVCANIDCFKKVTKSKALERAFETKVDEQIYIALEKEMEDKDYE